MNSFTCPVCGGKLNIRIGADFALCGSCGRPSDLDPGDVSKFAAIYRRAEFAMKKKTVEGYREAERELEAISFIEEAEELSKECEKQLSALQADKTRRQEFEKTSEKRNTALGVVLLVLALLFCAAAIAAIVYVVIRLANGSLPPWALWIAIGVAAAAVILFIIGKFKS